MVFCQETGSGGSDSGIRKGLSLGDCGAIIPSRTLAEDERRWQSLANVCSLCVLRDGSSAVSEPCVRHTDEPLSFHGCAARNSSGVTTEVLLDLKSVVLRAMTAES